MSDDAPTKRPGAISRRVAAGQIGALGLAAISGLAGMAPALAQTSVKQTKSARLPIDKPLGKAKVALVDFDASPFPYRGVIPDKDKPFLDVSQDGRAGHTAPRGTIRWEDETYSDRRALLALPKGFDLRKPALMVVFFHGNKATLERDVIARQRIVDQFAAAGLNALLVAPQFAVDAFDSSAGHFWEAGGLARFVHEAARKGAALHGSARAPAVFAKMTVVLVAYSGGYHPAAWCLARGGLGARLRGVMLFDALYGDEEKFEDWLAENHRSSFFFSAFSKSSEAGNRKIQAFLDQQGIAYARAAPKSLAAGSIGFVFAGDVPHTDFMTSAWIADPLRVMLARIKGFSRT